MCSLGYCHAFLLSTAGVDVLEVELVKVICGDAAASSQINFTI
jgi:hypothetical protein